MSAKRKRVNLGGLDIEVLSAADLLRQRTAAEKPVQACLRVADSPDAPAISADHARRRQQLPCEDCDALCWFDPNAGPGRLFVTLLCLQCMMQRAKSQAGG